MFRPESKNFDKNSWSRKTNVLVHEANYNEFRQNENLKQELLNPTGTTIAQACPFRADWSAGHFATITDCHDRKK